MSKAFEALTIVPLSSTEGFEALIIVPLSSMAKSKLSKQMVVSRAQTTSLVLLAIPSLESSSRTRKAPTWRSNYRCFEHNFGK
jgi:hypothetical protein